MAIRTIPKERGCGKRRDGGLYLACSLSPFGKPVEDFIIDPCHSWTGGPFRAPVILPRKDGVNDVGIWVGSEHYTAISDYIEEVRHLGLSRRIPANFDMSKLTPGKSRIILIHQRAIPLFEFSCATPLVLYKQPGPKIGAPMCRKPKEPHLCTFMDWPLGTLLPGNEHRKISFIKEDEKDESIVRVTQVQIELPSIKYITTLPWHPLAIDPQPYQAGAFACFTLTHVEFIAQSDKAKQSKIPEKIRETGWEVEICNE